MHQGLQIKQYLPTLLVVVLVLLELAFRMAVGTAFEPYGILALVLFVPFTYINAVLASIVSLLPEGPWQADQDWFWIELNLSAWLIASLVILLPILTLNYLLVVRRRYIPVGLFSIVVALLAICLPLLVYKVVG
jgi:hypothetical protein